MWGIGTGKEDVILLYALGWGWSGGEGSMSRVVHNDQNRNGDTSK